jgi:sugar lactone lactonase YvrE
MNVLLSLLFAINAANGFHVDVFARDLEQPQTLLVLDDGTLLVSRPALDDVIALRDRDGDGRADEIRTALSAIEGARGLAMQGNTLYIAGANAILAAERQPDGSFGEATEVVAGLHDGGAIGAAPDGALFVSMPRDATLLTFDAGGENRRIYARGRNAVSAFAWEPGTHALWGADAEGALHRIGDGASVAATLDVPKHGQPVAFVFSHGNAFSATNDTIVRVQFANGAPQQASDFVTGVRAAGLAAARDGSLYFSDDEHGVVYRVSSAVPPPTTLPTPPPMTSSAPAAAVKTILSKAFHVDGLRAAAAVVHDEEQDVYFVAGGNSVARVTPDGTISDAAFIDGLDAPKAIAIHGTELWIADGRRLRVFDRVSGAPVKTIDLTSRGAVSLTGLTVGGDDAVYVTDSDVHVKATRERVRAGEGRIFRISGELVEVALAGEDLHSPNAIAWDGLRFLVAPGYGSEVLAWSPGGGTKAVMRGPGAYDGIVVLPNGAVIVSSEYDEALHVGFGSGDLRPFFTRKPSPAAIGFDRKRNRLLIPSREGNWLEAWTLPPMEPARSTRGKTRDVATIVRK